MGCCISLVLVDIAREVDILPYFENILGRKKITVGSYDEVFAFYGCLKEALPGGLNLYSYIREIVGSRLVKETISSKTTLNQMAILSEELSYSLSAFIIGAPQIYELPGELPDKRPGEYRRELPEAEKRRFAFSILLEIDPDTEDKKEQDTLTSRLTSSIIEKTLAYDVSLHFNRLKTFLLE